MKTLILRCSYDDCAAHGLEREILLGPTEKLALDDERRICLPCRRPFDVVDGKRIDHVQRERPAPEPVIIERGPPAPTQLEAAVATFEALPPDQPVTAADLARALKAFR